MENSEEDILAGSELPDDAAAFRRIMHEYGPMLARLVRCSVGNPSDAEDVLQNTFIAIWIGFRRLRNPSHLQGWLIHVAQNRCRDYFRAQERREVPLIEETLQHHASRFGLHQYRQTKIHSDAVDALEAASGEAGETARRFYLEGLSIAEIAAASQRPSGTIKRQLFQARQSVRAFLGVSRPEPLTQRKKILMPAQNAAENPPGFPLTRLKITITQLDEATFAIDCRELRSLPIIPIVGERGSFADYEITSDSQSEWKLKEVSVMQALRMGSVHDVEGVEIEVRFWKPEGGWQRSGTIYARLTEEKAEFLAVHLPHADITQIETFLDNWFALNWGTIDRAISDQGLMQHAPDGSLLLAEALPAEESTGMGAGLVRVEIGSKSFLCLRVFDLPGAGDLATTDDYLTESYLTQEGRLILIRRYCRSDFAGIATFPVILDETERLVINGITFIHWYDSLTGIAL